MSRSTKGRRSSSGYTLLMILISPLVVDAVHQASYENSSQTDRSAEESSMTNRLTNSSALTNSLISSERRRSSNQGFVPSYEIVGLGVKSPEQALIHLLTKHQNKSSIGDNDFQRNLKTLKKVLKARQPTKSENRHKNLTKSATSLEDDINTINVLIGMLMLANRRLMEQRDRVATRNSAAISNGPLELPIALAPSKPSKLPDTNASLPNNKRRAGDWAPNSNWQWSNSTGSTGGSLAQERLGGQPSRTDHVLVRPGFGSAPHLDRSGMEINPMRNHRPLIAHDLFQANHPSLGNHHHTQQPKHSRHSMLQYLDRRPAPPISERQPDSPESADPAMPHQHDMDRSMVPPYNGMGPMTLNGRFGFGHRPGEPAAAGLGFSMPGAPVSPMDHMVAAAKGQRAAALDHERRRLELEMALSGRPRPGEAGQVALHHQYQQQPVSTENPPSEQGIQPERHPASLNLIQPQQQQKQAPQPLQQHHHHHHHSQQQQQADSDEPEEANQDSEADTNQAQAGGEVDQKEFNRELPGFMGASDDFTDLFPPGILSEAEIREMRRDQEEQRLKQQQEGQQQQQQQESNDQEPGQTPEQADQADQASSSAQQEQVPNEEQQPAQQTEQQLAPMNSSPHFESNSRTIVQGMTAMRSNKTRRSNDGEPEGLINLVSFGPPFSEGENSQEEYTTAGVETSL